MSNRIIDIKPYGRLGNNIKQMEHSVMLAMQYDIQCVYFKKYSDQPLYFVNNKNTQRKPIGEKQLRTINSRPETLFFQKS